MLFFCRTILTLEGSHFLNVYAFATFQYTSCIQLLSLIGGRGTISSSFLSLSLSLSLALVDNMWVCVCVCQSKCIICVSVFLYIAIAADLAAHSSYLSVLYFSLCGPLPLFLCHRNSLYAGKVECIAFLFRQIAYDIYEVLNTTHKSHTYCVKLKSAFILSLCVVSIVSLSLSFSLFTLVCLGWCVCAVHTLLFH